MSLCVFFVLMNNTVGDLLVLDMNRLTSELSGYIVTVTRKRSV